MTETNPTFTIPPQMQGYCDIYMAKLRAKQGDGEHEKMSQALQRAITFFEQNPENLLGEISTLLKLNPGYFGIEPVMTETTKKPIPVTAKPVTETLPDEKIGPVEEQIMIGLAARFSSEENAQIADKIQRGEIKGSLS